MDPPDYNRKFAEEHDFGYPLISNGEAVIRQFGACRREDRCTGRRTTAVIRADGTLQDFIDPFDADSGPDELLKRLVDGASPLLEPGAHMDGLERELVLLERRDPPRGRLAGIAAGERAREVVEGGVEGARGVGLAQAGVVGDGGNEVGLVQNE